jgi:hypothetical protein
LNTVVGGLYIYHLERVNKAQNGPFSTHFLSCDHKWIGTGFFEEVLGKPWGPFQGFFFLSTVEIPRGFGYCPTRPKKYPIHGEGVISSVTYAYTGRHVGSGELLQCPGNDYLFLSSSSAATSCHWAQKLAA